MTKQKEQLQEIRSLMLESAKLNIEADKIMGKAWEKLNKMVKTI